MAKVGTVDFVVAGAGQLTAYVPEYGIVVLPLPVEGHADHVQGLDGPFGETINKATNKQGLEYLRMVGHGFRHISNNRRPIMKPRT